MLFNEVSMVLVSLLLRSILIWNRVYLSLRLLVEESVVLICDLLSSSVNSVEKKQAKNRQEASDWRVL